MFFRKSVNSSVALMCAGLPKIGDTIQSPEYILLERRGRGFRNSYVNDRYSHAPALRTDR